MSVALHDSRLFIGVEQADKFREEQKKFVFCLLEKGTNGIYKSPSQRKKNAHIDYTEIESLFTK